MLVVRRLVLAAVLATAPSSLKAQTPASDRLRVVRLQREVDSLRAVIDSLRKAAASTAQAPSSTRVDESTPDAGVIFSAGDWAINRSVDKMTDAPSCTGIYRHDWNIQLSKDAFYISLRGRGGVKAITLRFGDDPPRPLRLPSDMESNISMVSLEGREFSTPLNSTRLRAQVLTVLGGIVTEDIDLTGIKQLHDVITTDPRCKT